MRVRTTVFEVVAAAVLIAWRAVGAAEPVHSGGNVNEARVAADDSTGDNWMVGGRTFDEQHFSPLKQIDNRNIGHIGLAWATDIDSAMGLATEPIVVDGVIFLSAPQSRVYAIDGLTGKVLWRFDPAVRLDRMRNSWAARTNRGVAVWAGKVYVGTGDCRLVAIDATSGGKLWESTVCDGSQTGITGAPHVGDGKVFIGYNGSDTGVRGSLAAFDAATGKEVWRFWTVPGSPLLMWVGPRPSMSRPVAQSRFRRLPLAGSPQRAAITGGR
ncbi:MAG: PQQ-binding-like beta-propeller repeat protein [Bryobacteraceae bacterium]